jgi:hypothetical protein
VLDKLGEIVYYEGTQDAPHARGESRFEVSLALAVAFVLGGLVGYLMRSESLRFGAGFGGHEEA